MITLVPVAPVGELKLIEQLLCTVREEIARGATGDGLGQNVVQTLDLLIYSRASRAGLFPPDLFGEPAWDMLLHLAQGRKESARVPITALGHASGAPLSTALRHLEKLMQAGLVEGYSDAHDRRRKLVALSDEGDRLMRRYLETVGSRQRADRGAQTKRVTAEANE